MVVIWDAYDEIIFMTDTVEAYFDIQFSNAMTEHISLIFPVHLQARIKNHFKYSDKPMHIPQQVFSPKEKNILQMSLSIAQIDRDEKAIYICTMEDITEIQRLRNKLIQIEKSELTATISASVVHEIRNPLTAIKGFLQLIEAGIDHQEQYVQVLLAEVEKIEGLMNELLQIANPHQNKKRLTTINKLITDVILLINAQARFKDVFFKVSGSLDTAIYCHPNEIKQVLINLILNGADAMDCSGTIKINVEKIDDSITIEIKDHGHGMSEQMIEKINNEFYTTKEDGTGLGLVVTEQIIEDHEGHLSVFSMEDVGSTFRVTLPIHSPTL